MSGPELVGDSVRLLRELALEADPELRALAQLPIPWPELPAQGCGEAA